MKYYSEVLKKPFETVEELEEAETKHQEMLDNRAKAVEDERKSRKEAAELIEKREKELDETYIELDTAKARVKELSSKLDAEIRELERTYKDQVAELKRDYSEEKRTILEPAFAKVKEAQDAKYEAIKAFNEKHGAYTKVYTSNNAVDEYKKLSRQLENLFNNFWYF